MKWCVSCDRLLWVLGRPWAEQRNCFQAKQRANSKQQQQQQQQQQKKKQKSQASDKSSAGSKAQAAASSSNTAQDDSKGTKTKNSNFFNFIHL